MMVINTVFFLPLNCPHTDSLARAEWNNPHSWIVGVSMANELMTQRSSSASMCSDTHSNDLFLIIWVLDGAVQLVQVDLSQLRTDCMFVQAETAGNAMFIRTQKSVVPAGSIQGNMVITDSFYTPETSSGFSLFGIFCADRFPLAPSTAVYVIRMMRSITTNSNTPTANIQLEIVCKLLICIQVNYSRRHKNGDVSVPSRSV